MLVMLLPTIVGRVTERPIGHEDVYLVESFAKRKGVVRFVAAWALRDGHGSRIERLVGDVLAVALRRGEDVGQIVGHEVRRVGRRDVGEGLHRSWDAEARAAAWPKYRPESAEGHTPPLSAVVFFLGLDFGVEGRTVVRFVEWSVLSGVVGRQAGDTAVGKNLVSCAVRHGGRALVVEVLFAVGLAVGLGFCFSLMDVEAGVFFEAADVSLGEWHGDLLLDSFRKFGGHLLELFDAGKLVDVFEAEAYEEVLGRLVQDRAPDDLLAAGGVDELARHQRAEYAAGVDAANLGDLGRGNGLLIRDNGGGFERLERELQGRLETL